MVESGTTRVGVDYVVSFDTSAASFLRSLFSGRNSANVESLRRFMEAFQGNRINWDIRPYLHKNAEALLAGEREREIFETVLASEQFASLDKPSFLDRGIIQTLDSLDHLRARAGAEIAQFLSRLQTDGWTEVIARRRQPLYASVLFIALLEQRYPGRKNALRKLKLLIEFMDSELSALFQAVLWIGWRWFDGDPRVGIFSKLQPQGKDLVKEAGNISWDLLHMIQQAELVLSSGKGADVLIPAFLTGDHRLAQLWEVYPVRSCWARELGGFPYSVSAIDFQEELDRIFMKDAKFLAQVYSEDSYRRREAVRSRDRTSALSELIAKLEHQLHSRAS
ncbi:MAG: hypothetical protein EOP84_02535 [Verrucomicrobiaceae bacterium]|nr:MAG: hypothetical protein EOP84_02535 [Verrucomicrobiaceae bacterium]